mmetsp:Transcript_3563/g.7609  ORF Transcript_3563/g.7609 Transcript_3563/m.7609 type:complete len:501 (-) Transcript_3563:1577-3079(-)
MRTMSSGHWPLRRAAFRWASGSDVCRVRTQECSPGYLGGTHTLNERDARDGLPRLRYLRRRFLRKRAIIHAHPRVVWLLQALVLPHTRRGFNLRSEVEHISLKDLEQRPEVLHGEDALSVLLHEGDDLLSLCRVSVEQREAPQADDCIDQVDTVAVARKFAVVHVHRALEPLVDARELHQLGPVKDEHVADAAGDEARPLLEPTPAAPAVRDRVAHGPLVAVQRRRRNHHEEACGRRVECDGVDRHPLLHRVLLRDREVVNPNVDLVWVEPMHAAEAMHCRADGLVVNVLRIRLAGAEPLVADEDGVVLRCEGSDARCIVEVFEHAVLAHFLVRLQPAQSGKVGELDVAHREANLHHVLHRLAHAHQLALLLALGGLGGAHEGGEHPGEDDAERGEEEQPQRGRERHDQRGRVAALSGHALASHSDLARRARHAPRHARRQITYVIDLARRERRVVERRREHAPWPADGRLGGCPASREGEVVLVQLKQRISGIARHPVV